MNFSKAELLEAVTQPLKGIRFIDKVEDWCRKSDPGEE
jgi:hypothetical protein